MADTGGIRAGKAYVEVGGTDIPLRKILANSTKSVQRFAHSIDGIGRSLSSVGRRLAGFGIVATTPFVLGAKAFSDYESAMARVKAIKDPTAAQFEALERLAKQLARDTVFSATEAAQAMGNFAQAGFSVDEILKATGPTLDLAATAQIGIADAASIAATVMRGMGIEAKDLSTVIDVLAKAATTSNTDITMLGDAFKYVGPIARASGMSLEQITAAIMTLSDAGIQGDMAGTTLRGALLSLISPSEQGAKELAAMGVHVQDARGNFRGLTDVIGQFGHALGGMGDAEQIERLGKVFGDRQIVGIVQLLAKGADDLAEKTKKLGNSSGTAARVAGVQLNTLKGAFKLITSSVELLGIEAATALAPGLRKVADVAMDLSNALAAAAKANPGLIISMLKMVAGAIAAGAALVVAGTALQAFALTAITLTTPLGALAAALAVGAGLWLSYSEAGATAIAAFLPMIAEMESVAMEAFNGIAKALKAGDLAAAGKIFWAALKVEWLVGTNYIMDVWKDLKLFLKDVYEGMGFEIEKVFVNAFYTIQSDWASFTNALTGNWASAVEAMAQLMASALLGPMGDILEALGVDVGATIKKALAAADLGESEAQKKKRLGALGKEHARIEGNRQEALGEIEDNQRSQQDLNRLPGMADPGLEERQTALAAAKAELANLVEGAGKNPPVEHQMRSGGEGAAPPPKLPRPEAAEIEKGVNAAARKVDVAGTFNAAAVAGMGAGDTVSSLLESQVKATEKVEKQLEKLNDKARQSRLVFGGATS